MKRGERLQQMQCSSKLVESSQALQLQGRGGQIRGCKNDFKRTKERLVFKGLVRVRLADYSSGEVILVGKGMTGNRPAQISSETDLKLKQQEGEMGNRPVALLRTRQTEDQLYGNLSSDLLMEYF